MRKLNLNSTVDNSKNRESSKETQTSVDSRVKIRENQSLSKDKLTSKVEQKTKTSRKQKKDMKFNKGLIITCVLAVVLGVGSGYGVHKVNSQGGSKSGADTSNIQREIESADAIKVGDTFGLDDEAFKDNTKGYLIENDEQTEGTHKLLRPGGPDQTVYLTSSVVNLDQVVDMEVQVWGETFKAEKAGWFMDVGVVKVLSTDATPPGE